MKPVFILNGPDLNLLGMREPHLHGSETLDGLKTRCAARAQALGLAIDFRQSNAEGELVTWIQEARTKASDCGDSAQNSRHSNQAEPS